MLVSTLRSRGLAALRGHKLDYSASSCVLLDISFNNTFSYIVHGASTIDIFIAPRSPTAPLTPQGTQREPIDGIILPVLKVLV